MSHDPDSGMPVPERAQADPAPFDAGQFDAAHAESVESEPASAGKPNDTVVMDPFDLASLAEMPAVVPVSDAAQHAPLAEPEHYAPVDRQAILGEEAAAELEHATRHEAEPVPAPEWDLGGLPVEIEQDLPADFDEPEADEPELAEHAESQQMEAEHIEPEHREPEHREPEHREPENIEPEPLPAPPASVPTEFAPAPPAARPDPFPWGAASVPVISDPDELEQTLIVPRRDNGERFVLQFSTGESVTVSGTGLLGRNPSPQPGEYFDQLVSISDPGKSVSKTHLEFGQDTGAFWVSDRFSGNGSVVREPGMAPKRLAPGKRYRIVRGTRIDIAEQFFVVS